MSEDNNNLPTTIPKPDNDLNVENLKKVQEYIDKGLPGIDQVDDVKHSKMLDLYLSGTTYEKISQVVRINKTIVMFVSFKSKWYAARQDYLFELEEGMKRRVLETKLMSQDFMLQLIQAWQKKMGKKLNRYLSTDDEKHMNEIDLKELDRYLKVIESLNGSIQSPRSDSKAPAVSLNLGDGVTVTKKGENEVEITPKQKTISDTLQYYADLRRAEEEKK